jgi:hypothetical protein
MEALQMIVVPIARGWSLTAVRLGLVKGIWRTYGVRPGIGRYKHHPVIAPGSLRKDELKVGQPSLGKLDHTHSSCIIYIVHADVFCNVVRLPKDLNQLWPRKRLGQNQYLSIH